MSDIDSLTLHGDRSPVRERTRDRSTLSVALAGTLLGVFALVLVGTTVGLRPALFTAVALAGGAAVVWGGQAAAESEQPSNRTIAVASVAVTVGSVGLLAPLIWLPPGPVLLLSPLVLAPVYLGLPPIDRFADATGGRLSHLCWRSRDAVLLFALPTMAIASGFAASSLRYAVRAGLSIRGLTGLGAVIVLLVEGYLLLQLLPRAQTVLEERAGLSGDRGLHGVVVGNRPLDAMLVSIRRRCHEFWWAFGLLGLLWLLGFGVGLDGLLSALPVVGPAIAALLTSGLLQGLAGLVLLAAAGTVAAGVVHAVVVEWASVDPPRVFASATGGAVFGVLLSLTVFVPGGITWLFPASLTTPAAALGGGTILLAGLGVLLLVLPLVLYVPSALFDGLSLASDRTAGSAVAAALVFAGTAIAALRGAPAVFVFVGTALTVLTWDLGTNAGYLGLHLGDADARGPELVHALASVAVGVVGVGLAAVVGYVVGPIGLPSGSSRAFLAIALALVAALAFSLALSGSDGNY